MYISKIKVQDYKAFYDSELIEFKPGINIISGQNHSGKTALLEALSLNFNNTPHKSLKTLPTRSASLTENSEIVIGITITKNELDNIITESNHELVLPFPQKELDPTLVLQSLQQKLSSLTKFEIIIPVNNSSINFQDFPENKKRYFKTLVFDAYDPEYPPSKSSYHLQFRVALFNLNLNWKNISSTSIDLFENLLSTKPFIELKDRIYRFYAERMNVGICPFGDSRELKPDASNLAEVINCLQSSNPTRFNKFNELVSIVLPHIKRITIQPRGIQVEIMVWSIDSATERDDLAFPLAACGTGVSQVLAILYVVITSQEPRTIIIDEPQSFLHPGAARKLIEILKDFPQHQYFISTHSPSIISAANPSTITLLRYENCEAVPYAMSYQETKEMRLLLDEVGVHLSDVFGSDNILWVEGPTEERCFPLILEKIAELPLRGTQILAIKNTGDLEGKKAHIIFDVYDRLSGGKVLLPPAIGFILDRENKTEQQIEDLKKRSNKNVYFINRRMYENYLLIPKAIAEVANQQEGFREEPLTVLGVEKWLKDNKQKKIYFPTNITLENLTDDIWLQKVDGAKLLSDLFQGFSDSRVLYSKTKHSVELTEWLVKNQPKELSDVAELLKVILKRSPEL